MKMTVSQYAVEWCKQELELTQGDCLRFFARYGGYSNLHDGFSIGLTKDMPYEPAITVEHDGITFFVEESDSWYFKEHDLNVQYNEHTNEIEYQYVTN